MLRLTAALTAIMVLAACGGDGGGSDSGTADAGPTLEYQATASAGDFITIEQDLWQAVFHYRNLTNGVTGTYSYTIPSPGNYLIDDPSGNLLSAIEIRGYALVIQAMKTGPLQDTPALIVAIPQAPITVDTEKGTALNSFEFRPGAGGFSFGFRSMDLAGNLQMGLFDLRDLILGGLGAGTETIPWNSILPGMNGTVLRIDEGGGAFSYAFRSTTGFSALDRPGRSVLSFRRPATKDFSPSWAGTYTASIYRKAGCAGTLPEGGTASLEDWTIVVDGSGSATFVNGSGAAMVSVTLTPLADSGLTGFLPGQIPDACHGIFTCVLPGAAGYQRVTMAFMDQAVLFGSFSFDTSAGLSYDYLYGMGLRR
jgi:hypothetical protein